MAFVTLQTLLDRIRSRTDKVNDPWITDTELTAFINSAKNELDDLLVGTFEDYYTASVTFTLTPGSQNYSLSTLTGGTYYKTLGVDQSISGRWVDVKPYNFVERNRYQVYANSPYRFQSGTSNYRYKAVGVNLSILPVPTGSDRMQLTYVPLQANMSATTDTYQDHNGWSEYIVIRSSISVKDKGEEDTAVLQQDLERLRARIMAMAPNRDAGEVAKVVDVNGGYCFVCRSFNCGCY